MRPANRQQAVQHMEHLLARKLTGGRSSRVKEHLNRAKRIAAIIYSRFQIGPYQYQIKHLRWYIFTQTHQLKTATTISALVNDQKHCCSTEWKRGLVRAITRKLESSNTN